MIEQVTHLQGFGLDNPEALAAAALGPLVLFGEFQRHLHGQARIHAPRLSNISGVAHLQESAPEHRTGRGTKSLAALGMVSIGALSFWAAGPTTERTVPNPDAQAIIVEDHSYTMTRTTDMDGGVSRFDAITAAVNESLAKTPANLKIGLVGFGANVNAYAPTNNHNLIDSELYKPVTDQNGNDIVDAMDRAISYFVPGKNTHNEIVVASDGTIDDQTGLNAKIKEAKHNGIDVKVIVPGRRGSTYKVNKYSQPVPSDIGPEVFNKVGSNNIHVETSQAKITAQLETALKDTATHKEKKPYQPAGWLAGASLVALAGAVLSQAGKRLAINRLSKTKN